MPKLFTLQEAEEFLPRIEKWLRTAIEAKEEVVAAEKELENLRTRIHMMGGMELDPTAVAARRVLKDHGVERFREAMGQIEQSGCVVKDLDIGLVDFPARLGSEEVYLCWRLGEPRIEYWHRMDEGFSGRKHIQDEFGGSKDEPRPN